jgi:hypothetical protein
VGTSLADLVDDLEQHLHGRRVVLGVAEAAGGLHAAGAVLRRLALDGLERRVGGRRESAGTALASACERAGQAWPTDPAARTGQLIGIIGDVIGLQRFELSCEARWWTTLRLASAARVIADVIAADGPYADHPYLKQVRAAAAGVQQLGAAGPPDPAGLAGLDTRLPHPPGYHAASPEAGAAEELTRITAQLRPTPDGRQPRLTVRQIQSVLHASAAAAEYTQRQLAEHASEPWNQAASAWVSARLALAPFTEGATPETTAHDPLLAASSRLCEQLAKAHVDPAPGTSSDAAVWVTATQLPHIARHLDLQLRLLAGRAVARATALPITETRVDAWLGNTAIRANAQQLQPTRQALHAAEVLSTGLATAISQQPAHRPPRPATATREPVTIRQGTHAALAARDIAEQAHRAQQYDLRL